MNEPLSRTPEQSERIGNALIFLAMLGPLVLTDRRRLEHVDLALALLNDHRLVPVWWDQLPADQKLPVLQMLAMPSGGSYLVMDKFKFMHPKTQEAFAFRLRQRIRGALQAASREFRDAAPVADAGYRVGVDAGRGA